MHFEFNKLELHDLVLFDDLTIPLDGNALTVVRGLNKDSNPPNANGAGKSAMFNCLPTILYDNPPTAIRKKSSKDIFQTRGSIKLHSSIDKNNLAFHKYRKGKGLKLGITRNDDNLRFQTSAAAHDYMHSCFPISMEMFYQLVYIRGSFSNILLNGTSTARHAFFEDVFQLSDYDKIAARLRDKHKVAKEAQIKLETLIEQRKELGVLRSTGNVKEKLAHVEERLEQEQKIT